MRKNGFTLIELLAVIVIIALIAVIAVPMILGVINKARKGAMDDDARLIIDTINREININPDFKPTDVTKGTIESMLHIKGDNYESISVSIVDGKPKVVITGQGKFDDLTAYGTNENLTVVNTDNYDETPPVITLLGNSTYELNLGDTFTDPGATATDNKDGNITGNIVKTGTVDKDTVGNYTLTYTVTDSGENTVSVTRTVTIINDYVDSEGVNRPRLVSGMTAVKWSGSSWDTVANPNTDTSWYDYANKEWANAKTADGSMWVWIPRYIYKVNSSYWHTGGNGIITVQFTKNINDNWNSGVIGNIDTGTTSNASKNIWTNEPSFTFGSLQLTGFWMGKFEATAREGVGNSAATDDVTTKHVKVSPGDVAWTYIKIGNAFTVTRNMETDNTYGWGTTGAGIDTHLTRNTEWGAVAYLSKSSYGKDTNQIWINPNSNKLTGCAGASEAAGSTTSCFDYSTTNGGYASTTGNIYGVYDMSGGVAELTTGYINNGLIELTVIGASIMAADAKYREMYPLGDESQAGNYNQTINRKGDAMYETSAAGVGSVGWFDDNSNMPLQHSPWIERGGYRGLGTGAGVFAFSAYDGSAASVEGFRPVLMVNSGL